MEWHWEGVYWVLVGGRKLLDRITASNEKIHGLESIWVNIWFTGYSVIRSRQSIYSSLPSY